MIIAMNILSFPQPSAASESMEYELLIVYGNQVNNHVSLAWMDRTKPRRIVVSTFSHSNLSNKDTMDWSVKTLGRGCSSSVHNKSSERNVSRAEHVYKEFE